MAKDIKIWDPEDEVQWNSEGKKIANRNLWISIPASALRLRSVAILERDHNPNAKLRLPLSRKRSYLH